MDFGQIQITEAPQTHFMGRWDEAAIGLLNEQSQQDLATIRRLTNPALATMIQATDDTAQYRFYDRSQGFVSVDGGHNWYHLTDLATDQSRRQVVEERCQAIFDRAMAFQPTLHRRPRAHHPHSETEDSLRGRTRPLQPTLHDARLRALEAELAESKRAREELTGLVFQQREATDRANQALQANAAEIHRLRTTIHTLEQTLGNRETQIGRLQAETTDLRRTLEHSQQRTAELECIIPQMQGLETRLADAQRALEDRAEVLQTLEDLTQQLRTLEAELDAVREEKRGLQTHAALVPTLRVEIEQLQQQIQLRNQDLDKTRSALRDQDALQQEIATLQDRLRTLTQELGAEQSYSHTLLSANEDLARRLADLAPLVDQLAKKEAALREMSRQLLNMDALQREVSGLRTEVDRLRGVDDQFRALEESHATQLLANQGLLADAQRLHEVQATLRAKEVELTDLRRSLAISQEALAQADERNLRLNTDLDVLRETLALTKKRNEDLEGLLATNTAQLERQAKDHADKMATKDQMLLQYSSLLEQREELNQRHARLEKRTQALETENTQLLQALQSKEEQIQDLLAENEQMRATGLPPGALSAADATRLQLANKGLNEAIAAAAAENEELRGGNQDLLTENMRLRRQLDEARKAHATVRELLETAARLPARPTAEEKAAAAAKEKKRLNAVLKQAVARGNEIRAAQGARKTKEAVTEVDKGTRTGALSLQERSVVPIASPRAESPEPITARTYSEGSVVSLEVEVSALRKTLAERDEQAFKLEETIEKLQLQLQANELAKDAAIAKVRQAAEEAQQRLAEKLQATQTKLAAVTKEDEEALATLVEQDEEIQALKKSFRQQRDAITDLEREKEQMGTDTRAAQREIDSLKHTLEASEVRKTLLENEVLRLQAEFTAIEREFRKLEASTPGEIARLQALIKEKEGLLQTARSAALKSAQEIAPLRSKIQELERKLQEQALELGSREETLSSLQRASDAFEIEKRVIEELRKAFETIQQTPARDRSIDLDRQIAELAAQYKESTTIQNFAQLIHQTTAALDKTASLEASLVESEELLSRTNRSSEALEAKCRQLEEQLADMPSLRQQLTALQSDKRRTAKELLESTQSRFQAQQELERLRASLIREKAKIEEGAQAKITEALGQVQELTASFAAIQTAYAISQETFQGFQGTIAEQSGEILALKALKEAHLTEIAALTKKVETLERQNLTNGYDDEELTAQMASNAQELTRLRKENQAISDRLSALEAENTELDTAFKESNALVLAWEEELSGLRQMKDTILQALRLMQTDLQQKRQEADPPSATENHLSILIQHIQGL